MRVSDILPGGLVGESAPTFEQVSLNGLTQAIEIPLISVPGMAITLLEFVIVFLDALAHLSVVALILAQPIVTTILDVRLGLLQSESGQHLRDEVHQYSLSRPEEADTFIRSEGFGCFHRGMIETYAEIGLGHRRNGYRISSDTHLCQQSFV